MGKQVAIVFEFTDATSTDQAFSLLQELGYDPAMHSPTSLHIHVVDEDLTSALEIVQAHGGTLVEQATLKDELLASTAYSLDAVTIPAHMVNEDWVANEELPGIGDVSSFLARD
jgi:hypothetical protein